MTEDEAELLLHNINNGIEIDYARLSLQTEQGNETSDFYKLSYKDRKCVFLGDNGSCKVYKDRPAVCRTNAVVGLASQCSTDGKEQGAIRLVKTSKADMVIVGAYANATESGTLPKMLTKVLKAKHAKDNNGTVKSLFEKIEKIIGRKSVSKDFEL